MTSDYPVTIRHATPLHIPDMLKLERTSATAAHWSEAEYGRLFQAGSSGARLALVACPFSEDLSGEESAVVGFLIAHRITAEWELENVVVRAEFRGKGLGTQLLQGLLEHVQQTKGECVFLEVRESNLAARKLYEKLGFSETGRRKSYYANPLEDALLYSKAVRGERTAR